MKQALCLFLLLTFHPGFFTQGQQERPEDIETWLSWVQICAEHYNVPPEFALAVAQVESGLPGGPRIRFGRLGRSKYYGPFGIHRCFKKHWPIDNPHINAWVGIRALRGVGGDRRMQRKALRRYNASFSEAYFRAIKGCERRNREEGIFKKYERYHAAIGVK